MRADYHITNGIEMDKARPSTQAPERAAGAIPHVIAVTSGKGGVGKTSLSVNLALALARLGRKVCILDADTGFANVNILMGLTPEFSLEHVIYADKSVADIMLDGPHSLKVIPGARSLADGVELEPRQQLHLCRELAKIERGFDYLFVDTAAGFNETAMNFIHASHQTLIVLTPEPTSLTDAFSLVRMLHRRGRRKNLHIVVNMCKSARQAREVFYRFNGAVDKYIGVRLNYLGFVLRDESLQHAVTMQSPVALFDRDDPSSQSFFRLAEALGETLSTEQPKIGFSAWWHALYRRQQAGAVVENQDSSEPGSGKGPETETGPVSPAPNKPKPPVAPVKDIQEPEGQRMANALAGESGGEELRRRELYNLQTRLLTLLAGRDLPSREVNRLRKALMAAIDEYYPEAADRTEVGDLAARLAGPAGNPDNAGDQAAVAAICQHRYDEARFGSQAVLVEKLRANSDMPVLDLLELMRDRR